MDSSNPTIPALADEIRAASHALDPEITAKRAKFIADELERMGPDMEARFEFYVRSHFSARAVKKILQQEVSLAHRDNLEAAAASFQSGNKSFYDNLHKNAKGAKSDEHSTAAPIITDEMAIVVAGIAKLFLGELVDIAREVMRNRTMFEDAHSGKRDPAIVSLLSSHGAGGSSSSSQSLAADDMPDDKSKGKGKGKGKARDQDKDRGVRCEGGGEGGGEGEGEGKGEGKGEGEGAVTTSGYESQYTAYQLMPADIAEAANRMHDDNKLGRPARASSHLFGGTHRGDRLGTALMSASNLLYDVTDVRHAGESMVEASGAGAGTGASTASLSDTLVSGNTHEALLAILRHVLRKESGTDYQSEDEDEEGEEEEEVQEKDGMKEKAEEQLGATDVSDSNEFTMDVQSESAPFGERNSSTYFSKADKQHLTVIAHKHNVDLLHAYQGAEEVRKNKWYKARAKQAEDEARRIVEAQAAAAAKAAQEAALALQREKIAAQTALQLANRNAQQQAQAEQVVRVQAAAAAAVGADSAAAAAAAASQAAKLMTATLSPQAQIHAQEDHSGKRKR
jgi:hypothetical protein